MQIHNLKLNKLLLAAMFLSMGLVLPFFTGQIQYIGNMLLPMHLPVMFCGLICGWQYGLLVGLIMPLLRFSLFGMPLLYPSAIAMAFELATYGFVIGFAFSKAKWKCMFSLYRCIFIAMLSGRAVWGLAMALLLFGGNKSFSFYAFLTGAFINAVPGILLQLILIPSVMLVLGKTHLIKFGSSKGDRKYERTN